MSERALRVLILGGTGEARAIAERLVSRGDLDVTASLAGVTEVPAAYPCPVRKGGFGGVEGLARHLGEGAIQAVVDATHPFAAQISANAVEAARRAGAALARWERAAWTPPPGAEGLWRRVSDFSAAAAAPPPGARVFLAAGREGLAVFAHRSDLWRAVRLVDAPPRPAPAEHVIVARPPYSEAGDRALFADLGVTHLVAKDAGGDAGWGKIAAAAALGAEVVLVARPPLPAARVVRSVADVEAWLEERLRVKT